MKRKQQITPHYMPYQTYQPRNLQQQQEQVQHERFDNKNNNKLAHLICDQQQQFITQSQQNLQPTHYCYEQQQQQIEPVKSLNTTIAATDSFPANTKMSSLMFGNSFHQTNLSQSIKVEQQQPQKQYTEYQQDYSYMNNNYYFNNNYNYPQQQIVNANINNFHNMTAQQQKEEAIVIKEEFMEDEILCEQFQKRKKLKLSLTTNLPQGQQPITQVESNDKNNIKTTPTTNVNDKITMDAREIANFLANELFMQQLVSMDGIQSGVPTLTTSTLTPTTLRSIEETFIHLTSEPVNAPYQAGFIPPPLGSFSSTPTSTTGTAAAGSVYNNNSLPDFGELTNHDTDEEDDDGSQSSWNAQQFNEDNSLATTDNSSAATDTTSFQNGSNGLGGNLNSTSNASSTNDFTNVFAVASALAKQGANNNNNNNNKLLNNNNVPRRNMGGRRPAKSTNMTPEEEEKRRIRRERNKEAAARCRKRRVDQTNELLEEVAQLEKKREILQKDIESLNTTKQELEYILESHRPSCQKIRNDMLSVNTIGGLIAPTTATTTNRNTNNSNNNRNTNNNNNNTELALPTTQTRSMSPIDIKPIILHDQILNFIKNEPLESALESNSSLDHDGPTSPKRLLLSSSNNPMIPPPLPLPNVASITASLNTPIVTSAPVSFSSFNSNNATLNTLNALNTSNKLGLAFKPRPTSLPTNPRNSTQLALNVDGKAPTDINGVAIQTPSTGVFNFDSLMDGGTGLTPVSGPLVPTCSSQNKHPLELATPTSEPSKLVSL